MDAEDLILAAAAALAVFYVGKAMRGRALAGGGGYVIAGSGVTNPAHSSASRPWLSGAPVSAIASLFNGGQSQSTNTAGAWMGGAPVSQYGAGSTSPDTVYDGGGDYSGGDFGGGDYSGGGEWV